MRADARVFKKQDDRSDVNRIVSIDVPELGCQGDYVIFPGFCDVHVHLREPGFSYKETIETGTKAAAHGGYTTICPMPNLNPVPDNYEHLKEELDLIEKEALIEVLPYGSCTVNEEGKEIASLEEMAPYVC
ncbi:MAG: amidohydrolase family protein, partial [Erysipelotrichaceae bacterium]|nr:amidohydrolase family protein [Erysipelotrichaceae bacterium]